MGTYAKAKLSHSEKGYCRKLGKSEDGSQPRFFFGHDPDKANINAARLVAFWKRVEAKYGNWEAWTLQIAKEVAKGGTEVFLKLPDGAGDEQDYQTAIDDAANTFGDIVKIYPAKVDGYNAGLLKTVEQREELRERMEALTVPKKATEQATLHQALDDWKEYLLSQTISAHMKKCSEGAERFKEHFPNLPLSDLGEEKTFELLQYWGNRPKGKRGVMAIDTCKWHIKRLREFFRWLHRSQKYAWRKPDDFAEYRTSIRELDSDPDPDGDLEPFTIPELAKLWQVATPLVRSWMLCALNFAFKQAEISSLKKDQIKGDYLERVRKKSKVKARWVIWQETKAALREAIHHADKVGEKSLVFVTSNGTSYRQLTKGGNKKADISSRWANTLEQSGLPAERKFSFKRLEKTAGSWIRDNFGSELASMFISHGTPFKADPLLEVYSSKPWAKLEEALLAWRKQLTFLDE